jgi:YesN/AraC family two-component response regulator
MYSVLIVDDETYAIEGIKKCIDWKLFGINDIYTAYSMRAAKEIIRENRVDIVLSDIEMPQGSGIDLLMWLSENSPSTISVFLTCHSDFNYAKQAIHLGVLDYLLKPISGDVLGSVLNKALNRLKKERVSNEDYQKDYLKDTRVEKIKSYIKQNIAHELSRDDIALHFHLNCDYLTRLFKQYTGKCISEYLIEERVKLAKDMLINTDMPVSRVANEIGYTNFSYFSMLFKKHVNMNPLAFRKKYRF